MRMLAWLKSDGSGHASPRVLQMFAWLKTKVGLCAGHFFVSE
jgi:hypothetical protein